MMSKIIQKQNDNSKYNRINQIYEMLKNNVHGFTIAELANELDVSTKTIQRDLYEVLSDLGAIKEGRSILSWLRIKIIWLRKLTTFKVS